MVRAGSRIRICSHSQLIPFVRSCTEMTSFFLRFESSQSDCRPGYEDHRKKNPQNSIAQRKSHTWTLDVTDDAAGSVIHELDADLGDTTTGA